MPETLQVPRGKKREFLSISLPPHILPVPPNDQNEREARGQNGPEWCSCRKQPLEYTTNQAMGLKTDWNECISK